MVLPQAFCLRRGTIFPLNDFLGWSGGQEAQVLGSPFRQPARFALKIPGGFARPGSSVFETTDDF